MSDLNAAVYAILSESQPVIALVKQRIRPDALDQNETIPALVFWRVSGRTEDTINGSVSELARARVTVEAYGSRRDAANELAEKARIALIKARGTYAGTKVRNCLMDTHQQQYTERPTDGTGQLRYVTSQDFTINYIEDIL